MSSLIIDPTLELVARNAASILTGHVVQVLGPVIDVEFAQNHLPGIYNALEITLAGQQEPLIAEVQQHRDITGCER